MGFVDKTDTEILKYYSLSTLYPSEWVDLPNESIVCDSELLDEDCPDPLGMGDSVFKLAEQNGTTVPDSIELRSKYLVSSKTFNPTLFLRDIHSNDRYSELLSGLRWLKQSIEKRSDALKMLVESNFSRFVKAKTTIDFICRGMKQNSLNQEGDYGILKLKSSINDATTKATQIFEPIIENRTKGYRLLSTLSILENYRYYFNLPSMMLDYIEKNDHAMLIREYYRCKDAFEEEQKAVEGSADIIESQKPKVFERIWKEVQKIIEDYKKNIFEQFSTYKTIEEQHKLICILLELGTTENPILYALKCQNSRLIESLEQEFKEERAKVEAARQQLAKLSPPTDKQIIYLLKKPLRKYQLSDAWEVSPDAGMWDLLEKMIKHIFIHKFHEFKSYLEIVCKVSQGNLLKNFPSGRNNESRHHLIFSPDEVFSIKKSAEQLVFTLSSLVIGFFTSFPSKEAPSNTHSLSTDDNSLKSNNPSDSNNEHVSFSFMPPYSDCLTVCFWLNKLLNIIINSSLGILKLNISEEINKSLQKMINSSREMFVEAINVAWNADSFHFYLLEDWVKSSENPNITSYPKALYAYESSIISKINELLYIERNSKLNTVDLIIPPSIKTISSIKTQFLKSLYIALEGLIKKVYLNIDQMSLKNTTYEFESNFINEIDTNDIDTRILFTLSNFSQLQNNIIAILLRQFETLYSISLEDESKEIQLNQRLFHDYIKTKSESISQIVRNGIHGSSCIWLSDDPPYAIQPYVFNSILSLLVVHSQISNITMNLIFPILTNLVKSLSQALYESFQKIDRFGIGGMLQVIVEVEFIKQVLETFIDEETFKIFGMIYTHLEEAYHHNDNQEVLQKELEKTKNILINYRKITQVQYCCFKDVQDITRTYF
ncbi:unnamed protein product [Pneumocystis jirovecii]|uniref:Exocyst complex component SEC5 n=2 Tax=Pneumocystis jirovecii TaxID=42068 RepID=L0PBQ0_PNEJI|nr:uncharacterized protein T551_00858 [Pneumocystis jirovecii RU7]KTW32176.1 hypothetical protein T551_00858 [Pneumocystis jirovecii RU7]CCJ29652.1 unnamed protein product [Pneumocystis jirovecii]